MWLRPNICFFAGYWVQTDTLPLLLFRLYVRIAGHQTQGEEDVTDRADPFETSSKVCGSSPSTPSLVYSQP
jgi:hypothetical protein